MHSSIGRYYKLSAGRRRIVSWYVMMGSDSVTLLPASRCAKINRILENSAWRYRTEFYPTYDYKRSASPRTTSASAIGGG